MSKINPVLKAAVLTLLVCLAVTAAFPAERDAAPPVVPDALSPAGILKVMTESKLTYAIKMDLAAPAAEDPGEVLTHGLHWLEQPDGGRMLTTYEKRYQGRDAMWQNWQKAETLFQKEDWAGAREAYREALAEVPECALLMTYIGQTCRSEGRLEEAEKWYNQALEKNPLDFMAWWGLANVLNQTGRPEEACRAVTRALLLNRNNPRVRDAVRKMYEDTGRGYREFAWNPCFGLKKLENGDIEINFCKEANDWNIYAMAKALYAFEPGFREQRLAGWDGVPEVKEERECLAALLMGMANKVENERKESGKKTDRKKDERKKNGKDKDGKKTDGASAGDSEDPLEGVASADPALDGLIRTFRQSRELDGFIYIEILLPRKPSIACRLTPASLDRLVDCYLQLHGGKGSE